MLYSYQFRLAHQAQYSRSTRSSRTLHSRCVLTSCHLRQMRDSRTVLLHKSINSDRNVKHSTIYVLGGNQYDCRKNKCHGLSRCFG
jgi:hypothetical protein